MKKSILTNELQTHKGVNTGNGFCAFGDGMFGQLAGKDQPDGGLNFARRDCGFLVVGSKFGGFSGDTFKDIVDEGV